MYCTLVQHCTTSTVSAYEQHAKKRLVLTRVDDRVAHQTSGDSALRCSCGEATVVQEELEQCGLARRRLEYRLDLGIHLLRRGGYRLVQNGRH